MTINLDKVRTSATERTPGDFRRHPWTGAPLVSHPTRTTKAGKPASVQYGRPSGLGKQIEDGTNLARWGERMVAIGGAHPDAANLLARMAALGACPDSAEAAEWRREADSIAAELKRLARAHEAAERGTHMHAIAEDDYARGRNPVFLMEAGEDLGLPAAVQQAMLGAYRQALADAGLEVLAVERTCVNDTLRVAGTLDAIVRVTRPLRLVFPGDGEIVSVEAGAVLLADLKTGRLRTNGGGVPLWWHSYAVQCFAYASSAPYDPDAEPGEERGEWPWPIGQDVALIAHLPVDEALDGQAVCRLIPIRLEPAAEAASLCIAAKAWAKRGDVFGQVLDIEPAVVTIEGGDDNTPTPAVGWSTEHDWHNPCKDRTGGSSCDRSSCMFCDGGLESCRACRAFEAATPTHCPGVRMTHDQFDMVPTKMDFVDGEWVSIDAAAPPNSAKLRQTTTVEIEGEVELDQDQTRKVVAAFAPVALPVFDLNRRQRVADRLAALTGGARDAVRANWPQGVPGMKGDHQHTPAELDAIEATIARHVQSAGQTRIQPTQPERRKTRADRPCDCGSHIATTEGDQLRCAVCGETRPATPPGPDEGGPLSDETVAATKAQVARLSDTAKAVYGAWAAESATAGTPFSIGAGATDRRCAIYGALFALAPIIDEDEGDLDRVRATIALVAPDAAQLAAPLSSTIAALTIDEADQLRRHAWAVHGGAEWGLCYDGEDDLEVVRWAVPAAI